MKIYLIRHAERGHGKLQDTLTEKGYYQTKKLAEFLKDKPMNKVFCSETNRTRETAKIFLNNFTGDAIFSNLLIEQDLGVFKGKTAQEWRDAVAFSGLDEKEFRPQGGENRKDHLNRVDKFIEIIKKENSENIAIFSQSGFISDFCWKILNKSPNEKIDYKINHACIHILEFDNKFNLLHERLNVCPY